MTERDLLDALHLRLCRPNQMGARRFVVAEHVGLTPFDARRRLDLVALDMSGANGYALDGYEIKTTRSDLLRELRTPDKAQAFEAHLDTFSLVAPRSILDPDLIDRLPAHWGVLGAVGSKLRFVRRPGRLSELRTYGSAAPLDRAVMASFSRSAVQTVQRVCAFEDFRARR